MPISLLPLHAKVRQGAYLPHWTHEDAIYHVVFRLSDSLPAPVVARLRAEREFLLNTTGENAIGQIGLTAHQRVLFSDRIEAILDNGLGACCLARDAVATVAAESLQYFTGARYRLHAWCIMPNHVHVIVQPQGGYALSAIVKSWKRFIAREANRLLCRSGEFWQPEYYDHVIRNETELVQTVRYIQANPSKAGLADWRWVWPRPAEAV